MMKQYLLYSSGEVCAHSFFKGSANNSFIKLNCPEIREIKAVIYWC